MRNIFVKVTVVVTYFAMILVNFMANALPINDRTTGEISELYSNLFAPAGITFSIWGLIYILLGAYTIYQLGLFKNVKIRDNLIEKINYFFIVSSAANIFWVFSWHYDYIWLSLIFMIVILYCLIKIATTLDARRLSFREKAFIRVPFSIYFGWITVATIANVTVFLVSINFDGFGISEQIWTVAVLLIGAAIGIARIIKGSDIFYGLVFIWAYSGILIRHTMETGFAWQYTWIIATTIACLSLLVIFVTYLIIKNNERRFSYFKKN